MTVYQPSEDTYFLRDYLEENVKLEGKKFLEVGTGNGEVALFAAENGAKVTASDINNEALEQLEKKADDRGLEIKTVESDLFQEVTGEFDVIVFNPPYLPGEEGIGDEEIWRGGEEGVEVTEQFLESVNTYLTDKGSFYIVASSLADYGRLLEEYDLEILDEKELWFETLYILGK